MSEPHPQEGGELTCDEWLAAVTKAGWTLAWEAKGVRVAAKLMPPTDKRQSHLPAHLASGTRRHEAELLAATFGVRFDDGFRQCPKCRSCYAGAMRDDVGRLCDRGGCPLRLVKPQRGM
jgi:hypothetical protein